MHLCDYGCGKEGIYQFKNKKWCCSKNAEACPELRRKNRERNLGNKASIECRNKMSIKRLGNKNPMFGRKHSDETRIKIKEETLKNTPRGEKHPFFKKTREELFGKEKALELSNLQKNLMKNFIVTDEMKIKRRKTNEEKGKWIKNEDLPLLSLYTKNVLHFTYISSKEKYTKEELKQRGQKKELNHKNLDHIFSIFEGFKLGILPVIIGSKSNIELVDCNYNYIKKTKCDITLEELFDRFEKETK